MKVELLYFDGCPNWRDTEQRLRHALQLVGQDQDTVRLRQIRSPEAAEGESFRGSPTVLVNGADPFADASAQVGLSCRVFHTPFGLRGTPTVEQLVQALQNPSQ